MIKGGYTLPCQIASATVLKVTNTHSIYFDRTMYNLLDCVLFMEKVHGPHKDPKLLECAADYNKLGPLWACREMRDQYVDQMCLKVWPALAAKIPEENVNNTKQLEEEADTKYTGRKKNTNVYRCRICGSEYPLMEDCPKFSAKK